jgi:hypothetical protein
MRAGAAVNGVKVARQATLEYLRRSQHHRNVIALNKDENGKLIAETLQNRAAPADLQAMMRRLGKQVATGKRKQLATLFSLLGSARPLKAGVRSGTG